MKTYKDARRQKQANTIKGSGNPHWKGGRIPKICIRCGTSFLVYPCRKDTQNHCSLTCANRDMADAQKGIVNPKKIHYGEDNYFFGKHWNGDKSGNWKGGISPLNSLIRASSKFKNWRQSVFIHDNFTCQDCGKIGGNLEAHHIKSFAKYPKLRFDVDNGKTLCKNCHENNGYHNGLRITDVKS